MTPTLTTIGEDFDQLDEAWRAGHMTAEQFANGKTTIIARLHKWRFADPEPEPVPTLAEVAEKLYQLEIHIASQSLGYGHLREARHELGLHTVYLRKHCHALQQAAEDAQAVPQLDTMPVTVEWLESLEGSLENNGADCLLTIVQDDHTHEIWFTLHNGGPLFTDWGLSGGGVCTPLDRARPAECCDYCKVYRWQVLWLIRILKADQALTDDELIARAVGSEAEQGGPNDVL